MQADDVYKIVLVPGNEGVEYTDLDRAKDLAKELLAAPSLEPRDGNGETAR